MIFSVVFTSGGLIYLFGPWQPKVEAAWYDDNYAYRQKITFTHNADITSDRRITVTVDTATLITNNKMLSSCADTRFTDPNGKVLRYQLTGTCNNASTTYDVVFPKVFNGGSLAYIYYGNPNAVSLSQDVSATTALTPSGGAPAALYKMDECQGSTANDSSGNSNSATLTVGATGTQTSIGTCQTSSTAWGNGVTGKRNYSLNLDGTDDFLTTSAFSPLAAAGTTTTKLSWGGWFYPTRATTAETLVEKATEFRIIKNASDQAVCSIYSTTFQDGGAVALTLNAWNHITCTYDGANIKTYLNSVLKDTTAQTGNVTAASSILYIGENSSAAQRYQGQVDDLRIYNYNLTATQVKQIYNDGAVHFGPTTGAP